MTDASGGGNRRPRKPYAVHDLPSRAFPFTIEAYGPTGDLVWTRTVQRPQGGMRTPVDIPGTGPGSVTRIKMIFADGNTHETIYPPK